MKNEYMLKFVKVAMIFIIAAELVIKNIMTGSAGGDFHVYRIVILLTYAVFSLLINILFHMYDHPIPCMRFIHLTEFLFIVLGILLVIVEEFFDHDTSNYTLSLKIISTIFYGVSTTGLPVLLNGLLESFNSKDDNANNTEETRK